MNKKAEQLADLIEKNPNAFFHIDNDKWKMILKKMSLKKLPNPVNMIIAPIGMAIVQTMDLEYLKH